MKIVLIGNYPPDGQESMRRFAQMLYEGFSAAGFKTEIWFPIVFFGAFSKTTNSGVGKWLGYLDKWIVFPLVLRFRLLNGIAHRAAVRYHISDHSNAPYLAYLPKGVTSITCHDVLAIRGGLGYTDAYVSASRMGSLLQKLILNSLSKANKVAAVSQFTLNQLNELTSHSDPQSKDWRVIHNAFNANFQPMPIDEAELLLKKNGVDLHSPFLLHVGSALPRKNRTLLLDMVAMLGDSWGGDICFAGQSLDSALIAHASNLGLQERVMSVVRPDHSTLVALYSLCVAFIFPSLSEGFGWPVIEAQACGAPVIASNVAPMPEVSGGAAFHAAPTDAKSFADAFLLISNQTMRANIIQKGFANCHRFDPKHMTDAYLDLMGLNKI
jgi:glycosyltransferase involved in cell wall biosynthesis